MSDAPQVWVVENDDAMRQALVHVLVAGGFSVRGFADARGLLAEARRAPPAVVITQRATDRIAQSLRAELGPMTPRLVLVSGERVPRVALTAFDRVITRPFASSHLIDALRKLTRDRGSQVRLRATPRNGVLRPKLGRL